MGIQSYSRPIDEQRTKAKALNPIFVAEDSSGDNVFYRTKSRCKGFVPFIYSPVLDNGTIWSTMHQFLNPVVNEMYTALRLNPAGKIMPTIIVREQPFSTKLYNHIEGFVRREMKKVASGADYKKVRSEAVPRDTTDPTKFRSESDQTDPTKMRSVIEGSNKIASAIGKHAVRTMYAELPRWFIDESFISSVNVSVSEAKRINFVQVWGRSKGAEFSGGGALDPNIFKIMQYSLINYAADLNDISRNGLRADITETEFDIIGPNNKPGTGNEGLASLAPTFAKMRADWLFNGHLKPHGTITCMGIKEPICEGDNLQVRGTVYHIEGLTFIGNLDADGHKHFSTSIAVSNGILARSIDSTNANEMPQYPRSVGGLHYSDELNGYEMPGLTDVQNTHLQKGYDQDGEAFHTPKKNDEEES
jgi:hypothetical protein